MRKIDKKDKKTKSVFNNYQNITRNNPFGVEYYKNYDVEFSLENSETNSDFEKRKHKPKNVHK